VDDALAFHGELRRRLARTPAVAVAHIVHHRGSTPRKTGACMLIDPTGGQLGTIGGGCGEAEVVSRAHRVLGTGEPALAEVRLLEEDGWESPSICGGVLDVFIERVGPTMGGIPLEAFFATLDDAIAGGRPLAVATIVAAADATLVGRKTIVDVGSGRAVTPGSEELDTGVVAAATAALDDGRAHTTSVGDLRVYVEPLAPPPELVVVGAGHVGAALTRLAGASGFAVTVLDDRETFANPARLPDAHRILVGDPRSTLTTLPRRADRHVVLVTRGHRLDADCLRVALDLDLAYLGMIGSRRRVARIREQLVAEGVAPTRLDRLHAPIGLDIGAETPAEIAVAILAEIINGRRHGRAAALSLTKRPAC
jgi:xanthine dehydrogenase accessory factor